MLTKTCSSFVICGSCHDLRGTWSYQGGPLRQECRDTCPSRRESLRRIREGLEPASTRWPCRDSNKLATLCYCCGAELLESGSRWSVWFCEACKRRVRALNEWSQGCVIPIGRHSLVNGFWLTGRDALVPGAGEQFVLSLRGLFDSIALLEEWAPAIVAETARARGFQEGADVPLPDYLDALVHSPIDKVRTFTRLCAYFQSPVKAQAGSSLALDTP